MKVSKNSGVIADWDTMTLILGEDQVVAKLVAIFKGLGGWVTATALNDEVEVTGTNDKVTITVDADEDGMGDMRIISKALTVFFGKTIFFNNDIGQFDGI
jgi:hypothetical protein